MFKVIYQGLKRPNMTLLASGVSFGVLEQPLFFEAGSIDAPGNLTLAFKVSQAASKKPYELIVSDIQNEQIDVTFYNPGDIGPSGLVNPTALLAWKMRYQLYFMFMVERLANSNSYIIVYEFYEGMMEGQKT